MFQVIKKDNDTHARTGVLTTAHGEVETPAYIVVGTNAEVRELSADDVRDTGTQIIIANTYHLTADPGEDEIAKKGGLHDVMSLPNTSLMTDSGGFQVFSLGWGRAFGLKKIGFFSNQENPEFNAENSFVTVREDGVEFMDKTKNKRILLTPERSIDIQEKLGADIIYVFDECTSSFHDYEYTKQSLERTNRWAKQCLAAHSRENQQLWGIIQGGHFKDLREESAKFIASQDFDGIGIGGPLGDSKNHMYEIIDWVHPFLPEDKARHLLGIGHPVDILHAVERGVDLFDCVIPTREARHGRLWMADGFMNIKNAQFKQDQSPVSDECSCHTCFSVSRADLRKMYKAKDREAGRLATMHNVSFFNTFMTQIRDAINQGAYAEFKKKWLDRWEK